MRPSGSAQIGPREQVGLLVLLVLYRRGIVFIDCPFIIISREAASNAVTPKLHSTASVKVR